MELAYSAPLVFSGDGRRLAFAYSGSGLPSNTGVLVCEIPAGKLVHWLVSAAPPSPGHTGTVRLQAHCAAFSPDGRWIGYGGDKGRLLYRLGRSVPRRRRRRCPRPRPATPRRRSTRESPAFPGKATKGSCSPWPSAPTAGRWPPAARTG